jgi:hypothetical protein
MKNCRVNPKFLKIPQKSGTSYEYLSTYYYCRWSYIVIEALSSIEMATDCQGSRGSIDVTRSHHNITLHVSCFSCFLQFSLLFQHLSYHILIHNGSEICWFVLSRGILGRFKQNIYVLSGDESKHNSLLHWFILIEKKSKKLRIRPIRYLRK